MDEHEALLPKNKTRVVERGALKTILIAFCGAAVLAGVAVPRGGRGGGLRGAPTALKAAALKSATESGLVRDVDPSTRRLPGTRSSEAPSTTTSLETSSAPSSPTTPSFVL